jgi:hypothetical protein
MHIHVKHSNLAQQQQQPSIATAEIHITTLRLYFQLFTTHQLQQYQELKSSLFKIHYCTTYFSLLCGNLCAEIQGNCRAFHAEGTRYMYTNFTLLLCSNISVTCNTDTTPLIQQAWDLSRISGFSTFLVQAQYGNLGKIQDLVCK